MPPSPSPIEIIYPLRFPRAASHAAPESAKGLVSSPPPRPFPTIYWLHDPALIRRLSELERLGHIRRLERRIAEDAELRAAYHADHEAYRSARWAMLTPEHRALVQGSPTVLKAFRGGIAGIANFDTIKCLHAQQAHHLATLACGASGSGGTTLGRLIAPLLID